ncbi:cell division protein FtsK [Actinoallomurus sp. CA-142502]|uniref:cell division protein FtsK n=1 Tax=Actinoallomurus sp. CA-142502 TaxID=3239885 RepID=UPI003D8FBA61
MSEIKPMGDVIDFPTTRTDVEQNHHIEPPAPTTPDDGGDEVETAGLLVDSPSGPEPGKLAAGLASRTAQRRPIVAPWLRDRAEFKDMARWTAGHIGHTIGYHSARLPLYGARLAVRSPRGAVRLITKASRWASDAEAMPLRLQAVAKNDPETYMKLMRMRDARVVYRRIVFGGGIVATLVTALVLLALPGLAQLLTASVVVTALGWYGSPADKPLLGVAVVVPRVQKLTSEIVMRALAALGIGEINKAMARGGEGITFPAPITRDGPGWRADVELPYGVTVSDIMDRREKLASGLRRPLGCVWPESVPDEHPGRMALWVGDRDMSQVKPAAWPLAKAGKVSLFDAFAYGTDPRGRQVALTLMYANALIGAMPGMGKTFALRILALAAALDVLAQMRVFELKGTGDLSACEKVAHHYGSGQDDETLAKCVESLREVVKDLERRAKVIRELPKDICPENKVTPELAAKKSLGLFPLVFIIDECQNLFSHPRFGKEAGELCTTIIKLGRALGVILLLATQRPDKDSLPTAISANVGIRLCLRVMGQVENDMILGTSMYKKGIQATTFAKRDKGIGWLVGDEDDPQITRSYYVDNPGADLICDRARALRKAAGTLSGYAAGEDIEISDVKVSLITDILSVTSADEDKIWSETIIARLAELRPDLYGGWTATGLADALKPHGITTGQVWGQDETGKGANRRGIIRAHIADAAEDTKPATR